MQEQTPSLMLKQTQKQNQAKGQPPFTVCFIFLFFGARRGCGKAKTDIVEGAKGFGLKGDKRSFRYYKKPTSDHLYNMRHRS